jgi:hypothetical protein
VTFDTGEFGVYVALMIKEYVLGDVIDFYPGRRLVVVKVGMLFLNPGMLDNDIIVAVQTFCDRRQAGKIGIGDIGVAILTLNLFNAAVDIMTEWNRLLGPNFSRRQHIIKNQKHPAEKGTAE